MSGLQPVAVYVSKIPPGDILIPAAPDFAATLRLTMAAIDPSAEPEYEDGDDKRPPRATLKVVRVPDYDFDDDSDDSEDDDYLEGLEDDSEDDEEINGGPSEKKPKKKALLEALAKDMEEDDDDDDDGDDDEEMGDDDEDDDEEDDEEARDKAIATLKNLLKDSKGKGKAVEGEEGSEDDSEDDEAVELSEAVICTLDPEKHYQQPLDFVVGEGEKVFFKVSGTHAIHLTGNYVIPLDEGADSYDDDDDDDSEEDYDLSPDEDELALLGDDYDEESDDLDDLEDPRVTEVDSEEELQTTAKSKGKGKNKRPAEESSEDEEATLDDIIAKSQIKSGLVAEVANDESKKLSKAEKKRQKKLKKNDGEAAPVEPVADAKKEINGSEKKVQFAKNLEQGPTPSGTPSSTAKAGKAEKATAPSGGASLGVSEVQGVTVDNRKLGAGPGAKKGNRVEMRYIGKLDNGKVFDSNKSGKPFSFKLGASEVIKGWDIGVAGIQVGGERRLIIPAHLAYGNKALPGIPKNSKLTFDIKCVGIK